LKLRKKARKNPCKPKKEQRKDSEEGKINEDVKIPKTPVFPGNP